MKALDDPAITLAFDTGTGERTARAKGLAPNAVIGGHALRNALIPVITVIGLNAGTLLGGAVVAETVFTWPGTGHLLNMAIFDRDMPVLQGTIMLLALFFVLTNLLVDILQAWADPRISRS